MHSVLRPYLTAGLALTTAGLIGVGPITPLLPEAPAASTAIQLLNGGESLLNVPLNLLQDIINIPHNQIHGLNTMAQALFYSGPWFAGSPTNMWGEDPGDPSNFEALANFFIPIPELSGAGNEGVMFYPGIGQQLSMLANVQIPADPTCASLDCFPVMPTTPITGFTWIDQPLWSLFIATGLQNFPLINNWFQIPFSDMMNGNAYYFDPNSPSMQSTGFANDGFYWTGTRTLEELGLNPADYPEIDPDQPLMPWAGSYYEMDFDQPFINWFDSLMQPFDMDGFQWPSIVELARSIQALFASALLAFNPFTPGSPFCPGPCLLPGENPWPDGGEGIPLYYALVKLVGDVWPGNPVIDQWLEHYHEGTANITPPEFIETQAWLWRLNTVLFDLANGAPTDERLLPLFIDTSEFLPTLDDFRGWMGDYFFNIADNIGIFGPFDIEGLWDAIFDLG